MPTRAKFQCISQRKYKGWGGVDFLYEYELLAVTGKSEENDSFFASTPSGSLKIAVVRDNVFEPGKEYYLDFTEA